MSEDAEIKAQVERLERAKGRPELVALVPRVAAAGFGVIPIDLGPGWIEVAATPRASHAAIGALARLLEREVRRVDVREALIHVFLNRLYPRAPAVNFHTFTSPDFLADPAEARLLLGEKPHEPVKAVLRPDPRRVVLFDYDYRSQLWALDGPPERRGFEVEAGGTDLAFGILTDGDRTVALLHREEPLPRGVHLLARESYATIGGEQAHGWRSHEVRKLPFMIHPTELQVTGIASDGTLSLLVYDDVVEVHPGETPSFTVTYYFLSMGQRLKRQLWLQVHGLWSLPRDELTYTKDALPWTAEHLRRWLGTELTERVAVASGARE